VNYIGKFCKITVLLAVVSLVITTSRFLRFILEIVTDHTWAAAILCIPYLLGDNVDSIIGSQEVN